MDIEVLLRAVLMRAAASTTEGQPERVWSDRAPQSALEPPIAIFMTYQQVGGEGRSRVAGPNTLRRPRFQVNVWGGATRLAASRLIRAAEAELEAATIEQDGFVAVSLGDAQATWDEDTMTYGAMQDFSVAWRP